MSHHGKTKEAKYGTLMDEHVGHKWINYHHYMSQHDLTKGAYPVKEKCPIYHLYDDF
jgi:hypothetical protein